MFPAIVNFTNGKDLLVARIFQKPFIKQPNTYFMATLFILIPFKKKQLNMLKDLPPQADSFALEFAGLKNKNIGENIGATIDGGISVVYADSDFTVGEDDYIIVFAHGAKQAPSKLYSNDPSLSVSVSEVIAKLEATGAQHAEKILFMCCFSALEGHIAITWKDRHEDQVVYGGSSAISNLYSSTRTQIKSCCLALFEV